MQKRGFVNGWQNRRWVGTYSAYDGGAADADIKTGGTGTLPDFLVLTMKGTGYGYYYEDEAQHRYDKEKAFVSPVFKSADGVLYRFVVMYEREDQNARAATCYLCLAYCEADGVMKTGASASNQWDTAVAKNARSVPAFLLWSGAAASEWDTITSKAPTIENSFYNALLNRSEQIRAQAEAATASGSISSRLLTMTTFSASFWSSEPLKWTEASTDQNEIVARARSLSSYKYWYGGAGQIATKALADSLRASYAGSVWTSSYYAKALKDIDGETRVADCSYLVNYAYGIASPGNHGPGTSAYLSRFIKWTGEPKNGMIAWKNGHTGIYADGKTLEMVGIDYDYQEKPYSASRWTAILYDPNRTY